MPEGAGPRPVQSTEDIHMTMCIRARVKIIMVYVGSTSLVGNRSMGLVASARVHKG